MVVSGKNSGALLLTLFRLTLARREKRQRSINCLGRVLRRALDRTQKRETLDAALCKEPTVKLGLFGIS
jgi:hypothetical protein